MSTHNFNNNSDKVERQRVHRDTFLSRAQAELDEAGGRYQKQKPTKIIGAGPPQYPHLPPSSPWSAPCPSGVEPVLGVDVNALGFHEAPSSTPNLREAVPPTVSALSVEASRTFLKRRV